MLLSLDSGPAAAARYLPMCLLQSGGGGRGGPARHVILTSRKGGANTRNLSRSTLRESTTLAAGLGGLCGSSGEAAIARGWIFRVVLSAIYRESNTRACCRAMMTSDTASYSHAVVSVIT